MTLPEGLLLLVLCTALIALGIALYKDHRRQARCELFAEDLIRFAGLLGPQCAEGKAPPTGGGVPGESPAALREKLEAAGWTQTSPFGGKYAWQSPCPAAWRQPRRPGGPLPAGAIQLTAWAPEQALAITPEDWERIVDHINQTPNLRGALTTGFNGWPLLRVYPKP